MRESATLHPRDRAARRSRPRLRRDEPVPRRGRPRESAVSRLDRVRPGRRETGSGRHGRPVRPRCGPIRSAGPRAGRRGPGFFRRTGPTSRLAFRHARRRGAGHSGCASLDKRRQRSSRPRQCPAATPVSARRYRRASAVGRRAGRSKETAPAPGYGPRLPTRRPGRPSPRPRRHNLRESGCPASRARPLRATGRARTLRRPLRRAGRGRGSRASGRARSRARIGRGVPGLR